MSEAAARRLLTAPPNGDLLQALRSVLREYRSGGWLTIDQAAELADSSARSLQRRLALAGSDFSELVEQVRIDLAMELLRDTDISLPEIAQQLGYSSQSNFCRAFQRWTGKTPTEFRRA